MVEKLIQIAVARPVRGLFTYRLPPSLQPSIAQGTRVVVPFGRGRAIGFVVGETSVRPSVNSKNGGIRDIEQVIDAEPLFEPGLFSFLEWTASYYRHPLGEVLRSALPPGLTNIETSVPRSSRRTRFGLRQFVGLTEKGRDGSRPRGHLLRAAVDYLAASGSEVDIDELATAIPGVRGRLGRLVELGICSVREEAVLPDRGNLALAGRPVPEPTAEQACAIDAIAAAFQEGQFAPYLLHGVTGSGKTEVYLRSIASVLAAGRGALVLVPEIALTPQLVGRFFARFGNSVALLHSGLRDRERHAEWDRVKSGQASLLVGVRSAVFAPVRNLGIIVVDEEHDGSFKQEDNLKYNARDLAVVRARIARCPVILGSATPSLETLHNARSGRYRLLELKKRVDDRPMPSVSIIDMRTLEAGNGHVRAAFPQLAAKAKMRAAESEKVTGERQEQTDPPFSADKGPPLFSTELVAAIDQVLENKRQAILFLNRRGQSTYHICLACGKSIACVNCAVSLTLHSYRGLICHYCGHSQTLPTNCPTCGGPIEDFGMGTERVEEELAKKFPSARICRLDRDSATQADEVTALLSSFAKGEKDILVGTQMVAKGHDFPGVTLVGVLLADLALNLPDFRASERTFQLLAQVAGRAGRGREPGRVLVQTFNPEASAIANVVGHDFSSFSESEIELRRAYCYPPFCRLMAVRIDGADPVRTAEAAQNVAMAVAAAARCEGNRSLRLIGPAPSPFARLRGKSRWQILIKGPTAHALVPAAEAVEAAAEKLPPGTRATVDIDPVGML